MWKIEKIVSKGNYNYAVVKNHPKATKNGYVLEHRVVMENHLRRLLDSNEVVHHKNGNKKDNRITNLEVKDCGQHECGVAFEREYRQTYLGKKGGLYTCCSRRCRGKFSRKIQLQGVTHEVESAISGNILSTYYKYVEDNPEVTV